MEEKDRERLKKKYKTRAHERQAATYLAPKYFQLFIAHSHNQLISKSECLEDIVKDFFDRKTGIERDHLFRLFEKMNVDQIKRPGKQA